MATTKQTSVLTSQNAKATTTLEDSSPVLPLPDMPQGVMALGPRVTFNFITDGYNQANSYSYYDVVNVDGTSYIAIQDVPANTSVTNEDYWAKWNDPNAQFALLQDTVNSFDGRLTEVETSTGQLEENITPLIRKAIYIGNSYTDGVGSTDKNGIFALTKKLFKNAWKFTSGGAGFISYQGQSGSMNFVNLLQSAISSQDFNNTEITDIIFVGAWGETENVRINGGNYFNLIDTAMATAASLIKANFPSIQRICYTFAESRLYPDINNDLETAFIIHNTFAKLCGNNGIEYLGWTGWPIMFRKRCFSSDNYHPNNDGYTYIANAFISAWNGSLEYNPLHYNADVSWGNYIEGVTGTCNYSLYPDKYNICFGKITQSQVPTTYTPPSTNQFYPILTRTNNGPYLPSTNWFTSNPAMIQYSFYPTNITGDSSQKVGIATKGKELGIVPLYNGLTGNKSTDDFSGYTYLLNGVITVLFNGVLSR